MLIAIALAMVLLGAVILLGPRVAIDTTIRFDPSTIAADADLDAHIATGEARFPDIRPGLGKQIVWADPVARRRTPLAIVYVHGFSASPGEIRPLPDRVAQSLGANLFFTRLAGHGRSGDAMAEASVQAWIDDLAEAVAIGRRLGRRVVLMGTSTGATLIAWGATRPELMQDVAAIVTFSGNFSVQAAGADLLTAPWGLQLAEALTGREHSFAPENEAHARLWTTRYPTSALLPMAALVALARTAPVERATVPALFVYSHLDRVIRPGRLLDVANRWGGAKEVFDVGETGDPNNHVIAGDALSPQTTDALADRTADFIRRAAGL